METRFTAALAAGFISSILLLSTPVSAQFSLGAGSGQSLTDQTGAAGAPVYRQKNFIGDQRGGDLYKNQHPVSRDPWNSYQKLQQQTFAENEKQAANVRKNPPPNGPAGFLAGFNGTAGGGAGGLGSLGSAGALRNIGSMMSSQAATGSLNGAGVQSAANAGSSGMGSASSGLGSSTGFSVSNSAASSLGGLSALSGLGNMIGGSGGSSTGVQENSASAPASNAVPTVTGTVMRSDTVSPTLNPETFSNPPGFVPLPIDGSPNQGVSSQSAPLQTVPGLMESDPAE